MDRYTERREMTEVPRQYGQAMRLCRGRNGDISKSRRLTKTTGEIKQATRNPSHSDIQRKHPVGIKM